MILRIWLTLGSVFILFMELATPAFIETYDFRPNRLFIEYLNLSERSLSMLMEGHLTAVIFSLIFTVVAFVLLLETVWLCGEKFTPNRLEITSCCSLACGCSCFLGARSSFQHRGVNPCNGGFFFRWFSEFSCVEFRLFSSLCGISNLKMKVHLPRCTAKWIPMKCCVLLKRSRSRPESDYISDKIPTLTKNQATYQR